MPSSKFADENGASKYLTELSESSLSANANRFTEESSGQGNSWSDHHCELIQQVLIPNEDETEE